jgi:hypothetical protein
MVGPMGSSFVLDVAPEDGAGVSRWPRVLVRGATDAPGDDFMLEEKEDKGSFVAHRRRACARENAARRAWSRGARRLGVPVRVRTETARGTQARAGCPGADGAMTRRPWCRASSLRLVCHRR